MKLKFRLITLFVLGLLLFVCGCSSTPKTFKVSFVTNCSDDMAVQEVSKASEIDFSQVLTREGHELVGWFTDASATQAFNKDSFVLESDITLYAKWNKLSYTVTFKASGETLKTETVEHGEGATAPTVNVTGYTFKGWDKDFSYVTSNLEVNANLEAITYTVTFKDGTRVIATRTVLYGESAEAPDAAKAGYTFTGWDKEFNNVTSDLEVFASYTANTCNIKYYDGTTELSLSPNSFTVGDTVALPKYEVSGYVFIGWFMASDFNDFALTEVDASFNEDVTLYALNIKIDYNGGAQSWTNGEFSAAHPVGNGISPISTLPAEFEKDFYKYLSENELLESDLVPEDLRAVDFAKFSGTNPLHNGDPARIWNDTSTNKSGGEQGYTGQFLYDSVELDEDGNLVSINGGFLGTEPYKTKYMNLTKHLFLMCKIKYSNVSFANATNEARALMGFVIDGYFYGTQGAGTEGFAALRGVIPTTTTYYTVSGSTVTPHQSEYVLTTEELEIQDMFAIPTYEGKVFKGWFTDAAATTALTRDNLTQKMTIYAGWE